MANVGVAAFRHHLTTARNINSPDLLDLLSHSKLRPCNFCHQKPAFLSVQAENSADAKNLFVQFIGLGVLLSLRRLKHDPLVPAYKSRRVRLYVLAGRNALKAL